MHSQSPMNSIWWWSNIRWFIEHSLTLRCDLYDLWFGMRERVLWILVFFFHHLTFSSLIFTGHNWLHFFFPLDTSHGTNHKIKLKRCCNKVNRKYFTQQDKRNNNICTMVFSDGPLKISYWQEVVSISWKFIVINRYLNIKPTKKAVNRFTFGWPVYREKKSHLTQWNIISLVRVVWMNPSFCCDSLVNVQTHSSFSKRRF